MTAVAGHGSGSRPQGVDLQGALLRLGGDRELYLELLRSLGDELQRLPGQVQECVADAEWRQASHRMHALKGTAGTLGFVALQQACGQAEKAFGAEAAAATVGPLLDASLAAMAAALPLVHELSCWLASEAAPAPAPSDPSQDDWQQLLTSLRHCLQNSDLQATELVRQLATYARWPKGTDGARLAPLVMDLDFAQALHVLDALQAGSALSQD
jgi:HPt (histidine-containing phosphotransfer) domain-containing protein